MTMDDLHGAPVPTRRLEGWTVLHGPRVAELPGAAAECIVVGPGGVVVVVSATGGGPFAARRLDAARGAVQRAGSVITSLLDARFRHLVRVAVCVPDERSPHELYPLVGGTRGVAVVGTHELPGILHALPARLGPDEVRAVTDALVRALVRRPDGPMLSTADLPHRMHAQARRERAALARSDAGAGTGTAGPASSTRTPDPATDQAAERSADATPTTDATPTLPVLPTQRSRSAVGRFLAPLRRAAGR
ncbi:hypothetical protein [Cellulomonas marina]|uniref:NERD domain-containing protein n=1 Tax=Cellulomonas marina TaxID=988821 RepID=A0A1I0XWU3_9CELL|nr:hypothetical protein [Cellulomonas marina]GIG28486.1 hypothetical protein Cma02nite_10860 [Cellulomonas marina]SFB05482.1 hypothetical protein SAMN05421867_10634 [Cellulomonas marina]